MRKTRLLLYVLMVGALLAVLAVPAPIVASAHGGLGDGRTLDPHTRFYVPIPSDGALKQIAQLLRSHDRADALLVAKMIATPQAVWFTGGTPKQVMREVRTTTQRAAALGTVPILVAYDVPGRDCGQYSIGGAATGDGYKAWIDAFVAGLGNRKVVVILEPDAWPCCRPTVGWRTPMTGWA
jgi:endoglucanase